MPCYEDVTNKEQIENEIEQFIQDEEKAKDVLQLIFNICWQTDITPDPMSQWLALLSQHVRVQKWKTSNDIIEIYPSGTSGGGRNDRLLFQVGPTSVAVVRAYESEH
jgi:hypothetical protein